MKVWWANLLHCYYTNPRRLNLPKNKNKNCHASFYYFQYTCLTWFLYPYVSLSITSLKCQSYGIKLPLAIANTYSNPSKMK